MKIARLGAVGAVAGVLALGAAGPAFATGETPAPGGDVQQDTTVPSTPPTDKAPAVKPEFDVNPKFFYGGDTLTFTVTHCLMKPTIMDQNDLFVGKNRFTSTGKGSWAAKETTRKDIVEGKTYTVVVKCGPFGAKFTTKPRKRTTTPTPTPTTEPTGVPSGAPQTGDGSSSGGGNTGLMAAGAGVVLVGLVGGGLVVARRRSSAGA